MKAKKENITHDGDLYVKGDVEIMATDASSIVVLGATYYTEDYLKEMMRREYARGKRDGQQIHITQAEVINKKREMKTPMQELLEWVRATLPMDLDTSRMIEEKIESMLEKEKEVMYDAWLVAISNFRNDTFFEEYYNETFNTKEK
jgi:hypothetical protein